MSSTLSLSKHHGLGNDFLVLLDPGGDLHLQPSEVRSLCDRHVGVGADGVIIARRCEGAVASMELWNADGSPAEMSGNGIRCLAQALVGAGWAARGDFDVRTAAGLRRLSVGTESAGLLMVRVGMGRPVLAQVDAEETAGGRRWRARSVEVGNPHVVLLEPEAASLTAPELRELGRLIESSWPGGRNVEWVAADAPGTLTMKVWERGAGLTSACGTGSVAAAAVASAWGLVNDRVEVVNPGGSLLVDLSGGEAVLEGPSQRVGAVEVEREWLEGVTGSV